MSFDYVVLQKRLPVVNVDRFVGVFVFSAVTKINNSWRPRFCIEIELTGANWGKFTLTQGHIKFQHRVLVDKQFITVFDGRWRGVTKKK